MERVRAAERELHAAIQALLTPEQRLPGVPADPAATRAEALRDARAAAPRMLLRARATARAATLTRRSGKGACPR